MVTSWDSWPLVKQVASVTFPKCSSHIWSLIDSQVCLHFLTNLCSYVFKRTICGSLIAASTLCSSHKLLPNYIHRGLTVFSRAFTHRPTVSATGFALPTIVHRNPRHFAGFRTADVLRESLRSFRTFLPQRSSYRLPVTDEADFFHGFLTVLPAPQMVNSGLNSPSSPGTCVNTTLLESLAGIPSRKFK